MIKVLLRIARHPEQARDEAAKYVFDLWAWLAQIELADIEDKKCPCDVCQGKTILTSPEARLMAVAEGRTAVIWLPLALERRLRASLHRCNASATAAGWNEEGLFDTESDEDLSCALISNAESGIAIAEAEDGVNYDVYTGLPLEGELLRERSMV